MSKKPISDQYLDHDTLALAKTGYVLLTLAVALILNFIPLTELPFALRPDFAALVIIFWCINQPQRVGMTLAFITGLMMDVHLAGIMGHHALAYCIIVYLATVLRRRISIFGLMKQAPHIGLILVMMQSFQILITLLSGAHFPGWHFYFGALSGTLVWPIAAFVLSTPLRLSEDIHKP